MKLNKVKFDDEIYIHKNGDIGRIVGSYFCDKATLVFERLDPESGDINIGDIFMTEAMYIEKCAKEQYEKAFPPENECVKFDSHFIHEHSNKESAKGKSKNEYFNIVNKIANYKDYMNIPRLHSNFQTFVHATINESIDSGKISGIREMPRRRYTNIRHIDQQGIASDISAES